MMRGRGRIGAVLIVGLALAAVPAAADAPRSAVYGVFDVPSDRRSFAALDDLGVGWVRAQWRMGEPSAERRFERLRDNLGALVRGGIGLWLTVYHRDPENVREDGTVGFGRATRGGFPPADTRRYRKTLERAVAELASAVWAVGRTPGDWLVIQIGNEVVPRDVVPPDRPVRFWHGTGDEYLAMLALAYAAVKAVGDIPVAAAGISSAALEATLEGRAAVADWNARLLADGRFDWADVHLRHAIADIPAKVRWVRRYWDGPLAATEVAGPDPRTEPYAEAAQATDLVRRLRAGVDSGVDRLFWASLAENPAVAPVHRREGLIERGTWRRKPAFDAYRRLIEDAARSAAR